MKAENEVVERYLQNIVPPECEAAGHQGRLRAELLARVERRQASGVLRGPWKTAVLVLGLLAAAAAATEVAVRMYRWHFEGRVADGDYLFTSSWDSQDVSHPGAKTKWMSMTVLGDGNEWDTARIEQKRKDLDEVGLLRQQNARELVGVVDTMVNGQPQGRHLTYKYQLSGGRTEIVNEGDLTSQSAQQQQQFEQQLEAARLQGRKEIIRADDEDLEGQVRRTLWCHYVLADGRGVNRAEGDPDATPPTNSLTGVQIVELLRLVTQKQGTRLERYEATVHGRTFTFDKYAYRLADGTAVTYAEGEPPGPKVMLTMSDGAELGKLREAGAGEPLAEYTAEVNAQTFLFKPTKYVLSDGTEVVQAPGQPVGVR